MSEPSFGGRPRTPATRPAQPQHPSGTVAPRSMPSANASTVKAPPLSIERFTLARHGNVRAFAQVRIGRGDNSLLVDGWKVIQQEGQRAWVAAPSQERERPDPQTGQMVKKWYPVVELPDAWKAAVENLLIDAWNAYQRDGILPGGQVIGGRRA